MNFEGEHDTLIHVLDEGHYLGHWERFSEGWRWYPNEFIPPTLTFDQMAEMVEHVQSVEKKRLEEDKPITHKSDGGNVGSTEFNIVDCPDRGGDHIVEYFDCPDCGGVGTFIEMEGRMDNDFKAVEIECRRCNGTGKVNK